MILCLNKNINSRSKNWGTVSMKNKFYIVFLLTFFIISCKKSQNIILRDYIVNNEFMDEDDDSISGFLKEKISLLTPYGYMKLGPIGFDTGYQFDFFIYLNNIPKKIWCIEKAKIKIDSMSFSIPSFTENKFSSIDFYDNFSIKTCRNAEPVFYSSLLIPKYSVLHFTKNGNLDSIVIYGETVLNGKTIKDGTVIKVKNRNLELEKAEGIQ